MMRLKLYSKLIQNNVFMIDELVGNEATFMSIPYI